MTSEELRDLALSALEDMKGQDITVIHVTEMTSIADYMIICTGTSSRHIKSLADNVATKAKHAAIKNVRVEGDNDSEWILVDIGDVIIHVMLASARSFYSLEDLWEPVLEMRDQNNSAS